MKQYRYFSLDEFDSPDEPNSGQHMDREFVRMLDDARHVAGVPFRISSGGGFRTEAYNTQLCKRNPRASKNSSHKLGLAADILTPDLQTRYAVLTGLMRVGLNRIGIANSFIHVDDDPDKSEDVCWVYLS